LVLVHFARQSFERKRDLSLAFKAKKVLEPWLENEDPGISDAAIWGIGQVGRLGDLTKD
jgi:hypothetical protein